jgi:hypothetical protein
MRTFPVLLGLLLVAAAGAAGAKRVSLDYAAYAGEPVPQVNYSQLSNWHRIDDTRLVIWTRPTQAYLLTLRNLCTETAGAVSLQIGGGDGISGVLKAGFGDVVAGHQRCRVQQIQPVDLARMKADRAAAAG